MSREYTDYATFSRTDFLGEHPPIEHPVTLASSGIEAQLPAGTVLGRIDRGLGVPVAGANTGDGALADAELGQDAKIGDYLLTCITAAENGGVFAVHDPDGFRLADATVGETYDGPILFTIADGATDFVVGDAFTVPVVVPATLKHTPWDPDAVDGSQRPCGILAEDLTVPAAGDEVGVAYVHGSFILSGLDFGEDATEAQINEAVRALAGIGIHVK
jgi:hypothetical protein